jgi:hypothetical protein
MATDKQPPALKKTIKFGLFHRLAAAVALLGFVVTLISGIMADVPMITIVYRAVLVVIAVGVISRVVIQLVASYEEMNSGKA